MRFSWWVRVLVVMDVVAVIACGIAHLYIAMVIWMVAAILNVISAFLYPT